MEYHILVFIICVIINSTKSKPTTPRVAVTPIDNEEIAAELKFNKTFLLPKTINKKDIIRIRGTRTKNDTWLTICLTEGIDEPDKKNIPFFIKLDYTVDDEKSFMMGSIYKGKYSKQEENERASNYTEDILELVLTFGENVVHSVLNNNSLTTTFENKLKDISFLVIGGNFEVNELNFKFN